MNTDDNETKNKERTDITKIFVAIDDALPLENVISDLIELGYSSPETIILDTIKDKILYIDNIENIDGDITVYVALTGPGEKLWESIHA